MATEQEKIEEWKSKFFDLSEKAEKQKNYSELLEKSLSRLALAAQGVDPSLDTQLTTLRKLLRNAKRDRTQLEAVLDKVERVITQLDEKRDKQSDNEQPLSIVLAGINWPKQHAKQAKKLISQLSSGIETTDLINDVIALIENSFLESSAKSQTSLFGRLFSREDEQKQKRVEAATLELQEQKNTHIDSNNEAALLTTLLEKISFPESLAAKATNIRHRLQHDQISALDFPKVIDSIADLVVELADSAAKDKKEYETFLKDLTEKLSALETLLEQISADDTEAFEKRQILQSDVEKQMISLQSDVNDASEITQLKQTLNTRIAHLNTHLNQYHQADSERFEASQQQIKELNERLSQLEAEADSLRVEAEQARTLVLKDPLTGIWNRQGLNDTLEREYHKWKRYGTPLSMVVWDVDFFKRVNDEFGHSAGDMVLKTIATIFNKSTRKSDFIARFGGEEFVGLYPETTQEDCLALANKIRNTIEKTNFTYKQQSVPITVSAGIAAFNEGDEIESVFTRADKALYEAKAAGRNNCQLAK